MNDSLTNIGCGFKSNIIGVADSIHYLVGTVDTSNSFIGLIKADDIVVMNSIRKVIH